MICWHRWKVIEKEILPSLIEQAKGQWLEARGANVSKRFCIVTRRCEKCGAERVDRV